MISSRKMQTEDGASGADFKQLNGTWGHQAGDLALRKVADLVSESVRVGDFVFRYGGEEFFVVLSPINEEDGRRVAEKIRHKVESSPLRLEDGQTLTLTLSIGMAIHDGHPDYSRLVRAADQALYHAKETGRNRVVSAADLQDQ